MPMVVECHCCRKRFKAGDQLAGKRVKCPGCQAVLTIPALGSAAMPNSAEPNPFAAPRPRQAAAPPAAQPAPGAGSVSDILDDEIPLRRETGPAIAPAAAPQTPRDCPGCGAAVAPSAVLCVNCGYDFRSKIKRGRQKETGEAPAGGLKKNRRARSGEMSQWLQLARGCLVSFIGAMMGAFVWYIVAMFTHSEWGLIAWGLGGLAGVGMAVGYGHEEALGGICAAAIALVAIVIAKAAIFISILFPAINALAEMSAKEMAPEGVAVEEVVDEGEPLAGTPDGSGQSTDAAAAPGEEMAGEAAADEEPMAEASLEEETEVGAADLAGAGAAFGVLFFTTMFSLFDIVAIILACATAFKVASSVGLGD